jgi:ABC-2 type transport system permease protein
MLLFGLAFGTSNASTFPIGVIDKDNSQISQAFTTEALEEVPTLKVTNYSDAVAAEKDLKFGDLRAYITIPQGFGQQVAMVWQDQKADITLQMTYDESDIVTSQQIISIVNTVTRSFARIEIPVTIDANPIHVESDITYIDFMGPGIIVFGLLILIPTSARVMVRDKEKGFLSRLLITPTRPVDFLSGYSLCLVAIGIVQIVIFIAAAYGFGMDIVGSLWLAFFIFLLTALSSIGIGMVVASLSKSENQAEPLCWLFSMPLAMLSGCWFSIEMLPSYLRSIARAFPYAHAIQASRSVITRGVGIDAISIDFLFLVGWAVVIFVVGIFLFRRSMRT